MIKMPHYYLFITIDLLLVLFAFVSGLYRFHGLDTASRIFCVLSGITLFEQIIACYCAVKYRQNIPVIKIYGLIQVVLICLYFNYHIPDLKKNNIGIFIAVASLLIGLADVTRHHALFHFGGFFMYYEGILIFVLGFFSLSYFIRAYEFRIIAMDIHFWLTSILVIFWCFMIINLSFFNLFNKAAEVHWRWIAVAMFFINYACNLAVAIVFLRNPQKSDGYLQQ